MRLHIILVFLVAFAFCPFGSEAANVVSSKVILEIQPECEAMGNYFSDAAQAVLTENGYTFLERLKGTETHGSVIMEDIGYYLETGGYGILEYSGHGYDDGETSGETFATYEQAVNKKDYLIEWLYFAAEDLVIVNRVSGTSTYYALALTPVYTNNMPSECSVAFISTCYGNVAGDFNASCKVAGTGAATNVQLMASFNCLIICIAFPETKYVKGIHDPWISGLVLSMLPDPTHGQFIAKGVVSIDDAETAAAIAIHAGMEGSDTSGSVWIGSLGSWSCLKCCVDEPPCCSPCPACCEEKDQKDLYQDVQ